MKILHVLSTPRAEGTPNLVLDWLLDGAHEQDVFVLNSTPADLTPRLRAAAARYDESDFFSQSRARKFIGIAAHVHRLCRERRPDVLVCWPTGFANWVCLGARLAGVKRLLVHCGNRPNRGRKNDWITRYVMWPVALLGARCACCSDYVRDSFRAVPWISRGLFHTVHNCARAGEVTARAGLARAQRTAPPGRDAIMVATLERHKDHATVLQAARLVRKSEPAFRLILAGDGSLRAQLEDETAQLGLKDAIVFLGARTDVPELLGRADLFVFSTTPDEGWGTVLLEAMAAGLPVVASDVPACREVLAGGKYGTLVPPADPAALAEAILSVLRQGVPPERIAEARAYAERFTPQRMMRDYLTLAAAP
jgi:glycosyltransferase involved in cell wall biosynthesis